MHKKAMMYAVLLPAIGLGLLGMNAASAHGLFDSGAVSDPAAFALRHQERFEREAVLIGATVDEVKEAWAAGKPLRELAKEKGVTEEQLREKMISERKAFMKARLDTLVQKGVITQGQADARLKTIENMQKPGGRGKGPGMHPGFRSGFQR